MELPLFISSSRIEISLAVLPCLVLFQQHMVPPFAGQPAAVRLQHCRKLQSCIRATFLFQLEKLLLGYIKIFISRICFCDKRHAWMTHGITDIYHFCIDKYPIGVYNENEKIPPMGIERGA